MIDDDKTVQHYADPANRKPAGPSRKRQRDRRAPIQRRIERLQKRLDNWDGTDEGWSRAELSALQWALGRDEKLSEIEDLLQEYKIKDLNELRNQLLLSKGEK